MKVNTYTEYTCEFCGETYENENDCIRCESSHITDFKISYYEFPQPEYGEFSGDNRFPESLVLSFGTNDGEVEKEYILRENTYH